MRVTFLFPKVTCVETRRQMLQVDYTLGPEVLQNPYHISLIRSRLTRNLDTLYPEIRDEITIAFDDVLDLRGNGEHFVLILVRYSPIPGSRMEECSSAQEHGTGSRQN